MADVELHVVIFGIGDAHLEPRLLASLSKLFATMGCTIDIHVSHVQAIHATYPVRNQEPSGPYLAYLDGVYGEYGSNVIALGIVDGDLFSDTRPALNFNFGEARVDGTSCVIPRSGCVPSFIAFYRTTSYTPNVHSRKLPMKSATCLALGTAMTNYA